jgi:Family of unknown function (DUF5994)
VTPLPDGINGGWWPRSRDAGAELPALIAELNTRASQVAAAQALSLAASGRRAGPPEAILAAAGIPAGTG